MITFIGGLINDSEIDWYRSCSLASVPISSDTHQKAIIRGLEHYQDVDTLYICPCGVFPKRFKQAFVPELTINNKIKRLKSCNIPVIRYFYNINSQMHGIAESISNGSSIVIYYMPFFSRMRVLHKIKVKFPNVKAIVVVPDLIEHSYSKSGSKFKVFANKIFRKIESIMVNKYTCDVDGYVYLTEKMKEVFGKGKPYIVQEAIYDIDGMSLGTIHNNSSKIFVFTYCGKLSRVNGIDRLIDAFMQLKNRDIRLNLCGNGELYDYALSKSKVDSRITVFGQIPHEQATDIEMNSTVLINPRYCSIENAEYSFPSKVIEYLACGRPVISSHLDGIPSDYDSHLFYIENDTVESLYDIMNDVLSLPFAELTRIGADNLRFVNEKKSSLAQGKVFSNFLEEIAQNE